MKNKFVGFYEPSKKEIDDAWKTGLLSFDANTLLNLYRYTKSTREDFIKVLEQFKGRLWIPYQAAFEFQNNRLAVIKSQETAYSSISIQLDTEFQKIKNVLNQFGKHPSIEIKDLIKEIEKVFEQQKEKLKSIGRKHPNYQKNDIIFSKVTELFNEKVGDKFSEDELKKIYADGKHRYEKKIPPGYCDESPKGNSGEQQMYGDFIIWKELIKKIKDNKAPLIFVTDDRKEDWWLKQDGKTLMPRPELINEFYEETGIRILIYQADIFLKFANEKSVSDVKQNSINEISEIGKQDESKEKFSYKLNIPIESYSLFNKELSNQLSLLNKNKESIMNSLMNSLQNKNELNNLMAYNTLESYLKNIEPIIDWNKAIAYQPTLKPPTLSTDKDGHIFLSSLLKEKLNITDISNENKKEDDGNDDDLALPVEKK